MDGIRTGTRLERLTDLRRQISVQLEYARYENRDTARLERLAREVDDAIHAEQQQAPAPVVQETDRRRGPNVVDQLLADLGVTAHDVRVWAIEQGLLDGVHRGRIALRYVQAYATHRHLSDLIATGYARPVIR